MASVMAGSSSTTRMVDGSGSSTAPPAPPAVAWRAGVDKWPDAGCNAVWSAVSIRSSMHVMSLRGGSGSLREKVLDSLGNAARPPIL
jgi:hypothetical protein